MYAQPKKLLLAMSVALAMTAMNGAVAEDSSAKDLIEARQETQIWTTYALSPYLRAHDISVSVDGGKATLTGKVDEGVNKDLAKEIALGVDGVTDVDNQIVVVEEYSPPLSSSSRSYGEKIDDVAVTAGVKSKLLWSKHADGLDVDVTTRLGKVTLRGTADTAEAKDIAERLTMNTRGVVSVDNQLVIKKDGPSLIDSAKTTTAQAGREIKDSWITTKVKSSLVYSTHVDGARIEVTTTSGVVTLNGAVSSGVERALAIELANNIRGVKNVEAKGLVF
jgi:hyperosmotically inducible protein